MEVMIIDNEPEMIEVIKEIVLSLKFKGEIITFQDSETALEHINKYFKTMRLIFCDNDLGRGKRTGAEFSKILSKNPKAYFILMSGNKVEDSEAAEFFLKTNGNYVDYFDEILKKTRFIS